MGLELVKPTLTLQALCQRLAPCPCPGGVRPPHSWPCFSALPLQASAQGKGWTSCPATPAMHQHPLASGLRPICPLPDLTGFGVEGETLACLLQQPLPPVGPLAATTASHGWHSSRLPCCSGSLPHPSTGILVEQGGSSQPWVPQGDSWPLCLLGGPVVQMMSLIHLQLCTLCLGERLEIH